MNSSVKTPHGLITTKHRLHQPTGKTPLYMGGANKTAVANKTVDNTINTSYNQYVIQSQYRQDTTAQ